MGVSLAKGQKVDLTKTNPGITQVVAGLGWDVNKYDGQKDFDLDAMVFLLDENGKCKQEKDFVFYGNKSTAGVEHTGDNRTGAGEGDDEQIKIDLAAVEPTVAKIDFVINIHEAKERNQNFGQVSNAFIRIFNPLTNEELIRFDLGEDYSTEGAVICGQLYRNAGEWKFNAIGSGFNDGLPALCANYGIDAN